MADRIWMQPESIRNWIENEKDLYVAKRIVYAIARMLTEGGAVTTSRDITNEYKRGTGRSEVHATVSGHINCALNEGLLECVGTTQKGKSEFMALRRGPGVAQDRKKPNLPDIPQTGIGMRYLLRRLEGEALPKEAREVLTYWDEHYRWRVRKQLEKGKRVPGEDDEPFTLRA